MTNQKISGLVIILLTLLLFGGYLITNKKVSLIEKENTELKNEIKNNYVSKDSIPKNNTETFNSNKLNEFNKSFVSNLYSNKNLKEKNIFLNNNSNNSAKDYLIKFQFIADNDKEINEEKEIKEEYVLDMSGLSSEEKSNYEIKTNGDIKSDASIKTDNINLYIQNDNNDLLKGITTFQVTTTIDNKETTTNYIMKADYIKYKDTYKVDNIYSISPLTEEKTNEIFE